MSRLQAGESEMLLSEDVPVTMPALQPKLRVHTAQHFKALGDPTRERILSIIKHEPLTAKQLGERMGIPPGTVGHHLQVLEAAGLAQIVARRLVHGIVAKYYTRTARLFLFDFPPEITPKIESTLKFLTDAREELTEALLADEEKPANVLTNKGDDSWCTTSFPHARLSRERALEFSRRLGALIDEFATAEPDADGQVYALSTAFFLAPPYLQSNYRKEDEDTSEANSSLKI
ncbi:MAG TPA: winged helix-turn-helix domain-containing protein [Ktedonobacteraceae bacterium]|nr:winged helix-turn-helix domain-containing protein [Ktedonobacteraceae bacterium]